MNGRTPRGPQPLRLPDRLPGEARYGAFMTHLTGCADCGYGQIHCPEATELWRAYRDARNVTK